MVKLRLMQRNTTPIKTEARAVPMPVCMTLAGRRRDPLPQLTLQCSRKSAVAASSHWAWGELGVQSTCF